MTKKTLVKGAQAATRATGGKWLLKRGPRQNVDRTQRRLKRKLDKPMNGMKKGGKRGQDEDEEKYAAGPQESSADPGFLKEVTSMDEYFEPFFDRSPSADVPPFMGEDGNMFSRDQPSIAPGTGRPPAGAPAVIMAPSADFAPSLMTPTDGMPSFGEPTVDPDIAKPEEEKPSPGEATKAPATLSPVYPPSFFGPTPPKTPTVHPPSFFAPRPTPRPTPSWPTAAPTRRTNQPETRKPHSLSKRPTSAPTVTLRPTNVPTESSMPTGTPSLAPSAAPTTSVPTQLPTMSASTRTPTGVPTSSPTTASSTAPPTSVETSELQDVCVADDNGDFGSSIAPQSEEVVYRFQVETTSTITADDLNDSILPLVERDISDVLVPPLFFEDGECVERPLSTTIIRRHGKPVMMVQGVADETKTDKSIAQKWALTWFTSNLAPLDAKKAKSLDSKKDKGGHPRTLLERSLQNASFPFNDTLLPNGTLPPETMLPMIGENEVVGLTAAPADQVIRGRLQNACPSPVTGLGPDGQPLTCWVVEGIVTLYGFGNLTWVGDVVQSTLNAAMTSGTFDNGTVSDDLLFVRYIAPGTVLSTTPDDATRSVEEEDSGTPTWAWILIGLGVAGFVAAVGLLAYQNNQGSEGSARGDDPEVDSLAGGDNFRDEPPEPAPVPAPAPASYDFPDETAV
ncbi:chromosome segregation ATPase-like protein [Seminavis robusta]|uniref:Chromosome segregation ATPase-like protein n=1 Tax=Seminavis robusta TaxID=568900 RepID=A0A9N8HSK9_9STRA|nr:chromosome segregation ATPase-like protein [Seminavis robusta]|eukprot:Sro1737_g294430.1 chromosome segregation ATPase-like protein (679) ;mRNA; r:4130-6242